MRNIYSIKLLFVLLWMLPFILLHTMMVPHELLGKDHTFSWGIYEKKSLSADQIDALTAIMHFFEALCEGKTDIIREMMDENLREEYHLSLNDPSYPGLLKKIYGGSKIVIKDIHRKKVGAFIIDAQLTTPKSGTNRVRFEIEQGIEKTTGLKPFRLHSFVIKDGNGME